MSDPPSPRTLAFVFVRGGSKGLPGKNLRKVGGKSLLAHSILTARKCRAIERVIVSTDSDLLAEEALRWGAHVPFRRPAELAQDNSPEWLAWQHAVRAVWNDPSLGPFDHFVTLPATAPLRSPEDVEACLRMLSRENTDIVVTATPAARHPSFNMLRIDASGLASIYLPLGETIARRQDAPPAWDLATVAYAARASWILESADMWNGRMRAVTVPQERAIDIDSEIDLALAEFLWQRQPLPP